MPKFNRAYLQRACEEIDAAVFSGDDFINADNREQLQIYMDRWSRKLPEMADIEAECMSEAGGER